MCKYLAQAIVESVPGSCTGDVSVQPSAEECARSLLSGTSMPLPQVLSLAWLLPREDAHKATQADHGGAFYAGAFLRGGLYGLRSTCSSHPFSIQCFTRLLRERFPNQVFTSFGIFFNVLTSMHRDSRNAAFPNLLLALSSFTGGEVWQEEPGGQVLRSVQGTLMEGKLLDVAASPQVLQAHLRFHCTEPWSGDRVVLVGFSVDCTGLQNFQICQLLDLGFVLVQTPTEKGVLSEPHQSFPPLPPAITSGAPTSQAEGTGQVARSSPAEGTGQVAHSSPAEGAGQVAHSFQVPCPGAQVKAGPGARGQASSSSAPEVQPLCPGAQPRSDVQFTFGGCTRSSARP